MKTNWEIKKVDDVKDFVEIINIEKRAFSHPYTIEMFEFDFLHHPYSVYFKLLLDKKIIGYCGLWVIDKDSQITTIAIDPDYQGNGYGEVLLEYIIDYLEDCSCENLTLEVRVSNNKAINLYEKLGFKIISVRKNYYNNGEDAYMMIKEF